MPLCGTIGRIVEIERNSRYDLSFEWHISDFFSLSEKVGEWYASPLFSFSDACWSMRVDPNKDTQNPTLGIYLYRKDTGPPKTVNYVIGIRSSERVEKTVTAEREFSENSFGYGYPQFCTRSELRKHESRLMPNNMLILTCNLKTGDHSAGREISSCQEASTQTEECREQNARTEGSQPMNKQGSNGIYTKILNYFRWMFGFKPPVKVPVGVSSQNDASVQTNSEIGELITPDKQDASTETDNYLEAEVKPLGKRGCEKVVEDFAKLLASGEQSDVTVQVGDVTFKVHSAVLFARCAALSVSLRHETEEKKFNRIVIEDCESDVFQDFLHYLYTGTVQSLTEQNVFSIYRVADKYLADELKQMCLEHIKDTLSVQTFCEAVKLALAHEESDLLQLAMDFANKNIQLIIHTVEWQNFICKFPAEANEILIKCICPRS